MGHDVFCGLSLPVLLAFLALLLVLALMAPALARELATLRRPPPIRLPNGCADAGGEAELSRTPIPAP